MAPKNETGSSITIGLGPWGGNGGASWDDGTNYDGIVQIVVCSGQCIDSIGMTYDRDGNWVYCGTRGGDGGGVDKINLNFPDEYLTAINGYFGTFNSSEVVRSLTFVSNRTTYGPYGTQSGTPFTLPIQGGRINSFMGRCGQFLDALGIHITNI